MAIRGRDGPGAMVPPPPLAKGFTHKEIMMGNGECASFVSCVMMVMVMTVNCGGDDGVLLMMVM